MSDVTPMPSTKAAKKLKPPLKRSEIIEALAIRLQQKGREDFEAGAAKLTAARKALYDFVPLVRKEGVADKGYGDVLNGCERNTEVTLQLEMKCTPELKKALDLVDELRKKYQFYREPSLHELRQQVRAKMNNEVTDPGVRINALLSDPATVKALDSTLAGWMKPTQLAIAG